jgi:S1-C subfamily serine protease
MKRNAWIISVCIVAFASPALAAGGKCTRTTQACLNQWARTKDLPWAGIQYDNVETGTMTVKAVAPGSPAANAGIQVGDVVVAINGVKVTDKEAFKKAKSEWKVGLTVPYTISRTGTEQQIPVTPVAMPPEVFAAAVGTHMLENHVPTALAEASLEGTPAKSAKVEEKK